MSQRSFNISFRSFAEKIERSGCRVWLELTCRGCSCQRDDG